MSTNRLESFSDGVIAVAITLLVLGITVPVPGSHPHQSLAYTLGQEWPDYVAYVVSFVTIGIIWINHHAMLSRLVRADHPIMILNLLLLMSIGLLPFATQLMATYLRESNGQSLAAAIYAGAFLVMSLAFTAHNRHMLLRKSHMFGEQMSLARRRKILTRAVSGVIPYMIATPLAFVSPYLTLAICAGVAAFYALPIASSTDTAA